MPLKWSFVAVLALVVLAAEEARCTGSLLTEGAPNLNNEFIMTSCPHVIRRIATPQQISGVWYLWQVLEHNIEPYNVTCVRNTYGTDGERLTLKLDHVVAGEVNVTMNFTYEQNPNTTLWVGIGEVVTAGFQMGFASEDDSVLLMCTTSVVRRPFVPLEENMDLSMLFGRVPQLDEVKISAAVNETALAAARAIREVVTVRPSLRECTAPANPAA